MQQVVVKTQMTNNKLTSERKTIGYFPSVADSPNSTAYQTVYGHRFVDDVRMNVMPIGGQTSEREDFAIVLTTSETVYYDILSEAFYTRHAGYDRKNFVRVISEFIADSSMHLALHGRVFYEITEGKWPPDEDETVGVNENVEMKAFRLHHIPGKVIRKGSFYRQIIPPKERSNHPSRFVSVPKDSVFELEIPPTLGGYKQHQKMIHMLAVTSETIPTFVQERMRESFGIKDFDTKRFFWGMDVERTKATVQWGTVIGLNSDDHTLEYFQIYRYLRFFRAMALLREHIISRMNALLERMSYPCQIEINGLPSSSDIEHHIGLLNVGETTFDEALNAVKC